MRYQDKRCPTRSVRLEETLSQALSEKLSELQTQITLIFLVAIQEIPFKCKKKALSCGGGLTWAWAVQGGSRIPLLGAEGAAPLPGRGYDLTPAKTAVTTV